MSSEMPTKYTFRDATSSDASALSSLIGTSWKLFFSELLDADTLARYIAGPLSIPSLERAIAEPSNRFLVAVDPSSSGIIAGVLQLSTGKSDPSLQETKSIYLARLFVDQAYHGSSLARDLMGMAEEVARKEGYASIWLVVWDENKRAVRLYEKIGFEERGEKFEALGETRWRELIMEKKL